MGWRRLGDVDDKEQKLCRLLDFVVKGVETLKVAVLHGNSAMSDGDDGAAFDWKQMWCPDILWSSSDSISNIEDAQLTLRRMKKMKRVLNSLSTSLDVAIKTVSDVVVQDSQEIGLTRLPDDILAQIFEFYHLRMVLEGSDEPPESPEILSLVCKRFYHIAVRLPLLWKKVSPTLSDYALSVYKSRSQLMNVDLDAADKLKEFLQSVHPHNQWEALRLRCFNTNMGHKFYRLFAPPTQTSFDALRHLIIENDGGREGVDYFGSDEEEEEEEDTLHTIFEADEGTLASWHCPNLSRLRMKNVIPAIFFPCSNVSFFELWLDTDQSKFSKWDFRILRDFLQSMPNLGSLEVTLAGNMTFDNVDDVEQLALPRLKSLRMELSRFTRVLHISQFLDIIDTERLTELCLVVSIDGRRRRDGGRLDAMFTWDDPASILRSGDANSWLSAVFRRPSSTCKFVRTFPDVLTFDLNIEAEESSNPVQPTLSPMYTALPNVQDLRLKLPDYYRIDLIEWVKEDGGLRELRSMCIDEHTPWVPAKYTNFFREFSRMEQWKKFEDLKVVRSSKASFYAENLENYVGDKVVWIRPPTNRRRHLYDGVLPL